VCLDGDALVFVEVKFRSRKGATPEESVDAIKRARMIRAANRFLAEYEGPDVSVRYDVVVIDPDGIRRLKDVFWL
jgi:putative endonuclease